MTQIKLSVILLLFLGAVFGASAQNLGVHPTILEYKLAGGQSESQAIHLSNGSDKKVQFRLYLNDWLRDSVGGHRYFRADTLPRSCAKWVTFDKNFVELQPGQATDVTVKLQIPDDPQAVSEMKWAMLFIETVEEQKNVTATTAQAAVRNLLRIGVHIYQTPPSLTDKQVKVFELSAAPKSPESKEPNAPKEPDAYRLLCQNTGQLMLECKSYLELASMADGKKIKLDPVEFPVFPQQRRYVTFELPADLPKGKYSAMAVLDAGEDLSLEAVESVIEVK
jgi:hypothetical protein